MDKIADGYLNFIRIIAALFMKPYHFEISTDLIYRNTKTEKFSKIRFVDEVKSVSKRMKNFYKKFSRSNTLLV